MAGLSKNSIGVLGEWAPDEPVSPEEAGTGVLGRAHPRGGNGVAGVSNSGFGVYGLTATGFAGFFTGAVIVDGLFIVTGPKSAAVPHPDGSTRLLYSMEGPQPWFEDVGRAELVEGRAAVALDPDYAALVELGDYHVFLTPEGDCNGLFVSDRGPDGFEVRELAGGTGTLPFSYRLVAPRRDVPADRLPTIESPSDVAPRDLLDSEIPAIKIPSSVQMVFDPQTEPFGGAKGPGRDAGDEEVGRG